MPSSFTAVDLSRLPAPQLVETLVYEDVLAELVADLQSRGNYDAIVESDPAMMVLEVAAYRILIERARVNDAARSVLVAYATDGDLDQVAANFGVARLDGELDDAFRERVVLAPEGYSVAGPEGAYIYFARTASADVISASATSPSPGTVLVSILSADGDGTASPDLIAAVADALNPSRNVRPMTDNVVVQSATIISFAIVANVWTYAGPDSSVLLALGRTQLDTYIASCRKVGLDVVDSGIKAALHVAGVERVELPGWTDIDVDDTEAAYCTSITINYLGTAA